MWSSFLKKRYPVSLRASTRVLKSPGNDIHPVVLVLAAFHWESDWHPLNCSGVIQFFLFASFPFFCQVLRTCWSFHALLVPICFLLAAALGQMLCSSQQLFRKGERLNFFSPRAWIPTLLGRISPLVPPPLFESSQQ